MTGDDREPPASRGPPEAEASEVPPRPEPSGAAGPGPAPDAGPARASDPELPFDFAAGAAEPARTTLSPGAAAASDAAPRSAAGAPPRAAVAPTGRPRRRVFAAGRIRPPGVVRQEKAARVGRVLGKVLAWTAAVAGVWAAFKVERRRR